MKVMLDAGHYSYYNQSNVFKTYYEGNMAWKLQRFLKEELEKYDFEVDTTRTNRDKDLALYERGFKAKGYDLFLSLHSNACETETVDRVVIIKSYTNNDDTLAKALALCIEDVMQLRSAYEIYTRRKSNGDNWYGVIRGATSAGVKHCYILEHSFHTNLNAAKWLSNDDNLKKLAQAEAKVIANFFGKKLKTEPAKTTFNPGPVNKVVKVVCEKSLNVRGNIPDLTGELAPKIDSIQKGKRVTLVYVYDNNWGLICYDNKHGFVNVKYLDLIE